MDAGATDLTTWRVGDRVRCLPEHAWVRHGTAWKEKLSKDRGGVVIEVPACTAETGQGTLRVEWDSLLGEKADPEAWRMWVHSSLIARDLTVRE